MTNHPHRSQRNKIRLSLTPDELQALTDLVFFAKMQGYHPMTDFARQFADTAPTRNLVAKVEATWRALQS